jgi:hypothetical protein
MWISTIGDALLGAGMTGIVLNQAPGARVVVEFFLLIIVLIGVVLLWFYLVSRRLSSKTGGEFRAFGGTAFVAAIHLVAFGTGMFVGTGEMPPSVATTSLLGGAAVIGVVWGVRTWSDRNGT